MYVLAIGFGLVSYLVFGLGVTGRLTPPWLVFPLVLWCVFLLWRGSKFLKHFLTETTLACRESPYLTGLSLIFLGLFLLIGGLGLLVPETAFDALWYHLTLPKLYLESGGLRFFPGGLLYYSAMPQAMEMLYLLGLAFSGQTLARAFHWLFGILAAAATFSLGKKFLKPSWALLGALIFYSQLTVAWLSTAAYVDLTRTFLEVLALRATLAYIKDNHRRDLVLSGVMLGLAICVKLLSLSSAVIFVILLLLFAREKGKAVVLFVLTCLLTSLPWLLFGFLQTKTFFYPFFTNWFWQTATVDQGMGGWFFSRTPMALAISLLRTSFTKGDILTPIFLIGLPLLLMQVAALARAKKTAALGLYVGLAFAFWFFVPMNPNRFLLPYTPAIIILILLVAQRQSRFIRKAFMAAIFLTALLHLMVRGILSWRNLSLVLSGGGQQTFLNKHLSSSLGNPGEAAEFLRQNIRKGERVLVIGGHNLFYLPVAFEHESWASPGVKYDYLLVWQAPLPQRLKEQQAVFQDKKAQIEIYKLQDSYGTSK